MASIYRKYRPKSFKEMVGQNHIKLTLQNELEMGSFVHAYLFCGPRGLGKTTAARLFAKAVNCEKRGKGEAEPCNNCTSCNEINEAKSLDMIEIDAASHTGVDNVRENIIENVRFSPYKALFKVFIIDEVHMLSISAFNALLKTLEEPPAHAIFILCTTEIHKVPETIISRCQRFDFKKLVKADIIKRLKRITDQEGVKIDDEVFEIIASKADGYMRDAESLLGQVLSLGGKNINKEQVALVLPISDIGLVVDLFELLVANKVSEALEFINNLVGEGMDLEVFTKELVEFLRKLVLIKLEVVKSEWFELSSEVQGRVDKLLEYVGLNKLTGMIRVFLLALGELKNSAIVQLPLELAVIKVCEVDEGSGPAFKGTTKVKTNPIKAVKKEEVKVAKKVESKIDLDKIRKNWGKIIQESQKENRDLMFINAKMVWPVEARGDELVIGFQYDLHKERFEANSNKEIFGQAIKEIIGEEVVLVAKTLKPSELVEIDMAREAEVNEELSGVKVTEENILDQVLESFGGEVVEE